MIDALGRPQSVLLLGATSEIGLAVVRALPRERLQRIVLAARDVDAAQQVAQDLRTSMRTTATEPSTKPPTEPSVTVVHCDALALDDHGPLLDEVFAQDVDVTVLAIGALGDTASAQAHPEEAVDLARVTYLGPANLLLHLAPRLRRQGHGVVVVLSSVAALQARPSNYLYGAAKAALDHTARGVWDSLDGSGARLLLVRPGFVRTRMTAHLPTPPLAVDATEVAAAIVAHLSDSSRVVYVPSAARWLGLVLRILPRSLLRRIPA